LEDDVLLLFGKRGVMFWIDRVTNWCTCGCVSCCPVSGGGEV